MIGRLVAFSLRQWKLVLCLGLVLGVGGALAFKALPIEAYPDVADTWVQVITQWPGHAAEEVERQITVPIEIQLNGVPGHTHLRSLSEFGLSVVTVLFDEKTTPFVARQNVQQAVAQVTLPAGVQPNLAPMSSPTGQVMFYVLDSKRPVMELKEIEDWELEKRFKSVPGVADVSSFGGTVKQYQVLVDPLALAHYGLTTVNIVQALSANNQNSGGGFILHGDQSFNVRGVGNISGVADLENVVLAQHSGTPVRIRNIGRVVIGPQPRLGKVSYVQRRPDGTIDDRDDVVIGIVLSRTGEQDETVLQRVHDRIREIDQKFLPSDIRIKPYLDRSDLIAFTTRTVERNMVEGMILVLVVLLFFLGNARTALIVAVTIPLSLLFASILLNLNHIPANLLSLGALDFGMVVDGAVVMVENIHRHKQRLKGTGASLFDLIVNAAREVERPIFYAITIIILAYLPVFTLQRVEGRLFRPMAWTVAFALVGALLLALTVIPALCYWLLRGDDHKEWENPLMTWVAEVYRRDLEWALDHPSVVIGLSVLSFLVSLFLAFGGPVGSEFLPHLDEGAIWLRGTMPPSTSYELADATMRKTRAELMTFSEVPQMQCQIGRPDDGTDAAGYYNLECFVDLLPRGKWRREFKTKEKLIEAMSGRLAKLPGVIWNFSQPISDNVEEMMSGVKGALVVKLYGEDLRVLAQKGREIKQTLAQVPGVEDLGLFEELGQPNINIVVDRDKISRYGLNISDVQDVIETAVGGKAASQVIEGEKRFDIVVRYLPEYREDISAIRRIQVATPDGFRIPLEGLATIKVEDGASLIYRENNARYIAVKFSVRNRDLGGTVADAQKRVKRAVLLPEGYSLDWTGEFESQRRAEARLAVVIPLTVLAIFFVLYLCFDSVKWALVQMACVLMARIGGVLALYLTGTNFSVSSGIGFLAVFGVSVQTGVILVSYITQLREEGLPLRQAITTGALVRLRPILMTMLVATFGLLPAALSHEIGSDSQRPMAIVIVGGLITDLVMGFMLLPVLYMMFADPTDVSDSGSDIAKD